MPGELIITNGDTAAATLRAAGFGDEVLAWQDILFEGPVPQTSSLEALSAIRAAYLDRAYGEPGRDALVEFLARDALLERNRDYDRVMIWLEHDLLDQLQLIQLLAWFADHPRDGGGLFLVQADDYLGACSERPGDKWYIGRFADRAATVSDEQMRVAHRAWDAFRQPRPAAWAALHLENDALPFLDASISRMLDELPDAATGLGRTEQLVISTIGSDKCPANVALLFGAFLDAEQPHFMGDWSLFAIVARLASGGAPLIGGIQGAYQMHDLDARRLFLTSSKPQLTDLGRAVLEGRTDYAKHAAIDRWWGGTHLTNDNLWRWDRQNARLVAP